MLESVRQYFQDWSDACEYANECAPDLSFLGNGEPFTALIAIAAACALVWAVNETRIKRRVLARPIAAAQPPVERMTAVQNIQQEPAVAERLAA